MKLFGLIHGFVLLSTVLVGVVAIKQGRKGRRWPLALLAALDLLAYPLNQAAYLALDFQSAMDNLLPLQLCDVSAILCGFALLTERRGVCELAYFWGMAGAMQAMLTPNMPYGPENPVFWSFFLQHAAIVISALYLPLVLRWRPSWASFLRVIPWGLVYVAGAMSVNYFAGTNFGFLSRKPEGASLLDHLGPWPVYLFWMHVIGYVIYLLLFLPFCLQREGGK